MLKWYISEKLILILIFLNKYLVSILLKQVNKILSKNKKY